MDCTDSSSFRSTIKKVEDNNAKKKKKGSMICMALPVKAGRGIHYHNKCSATKSHFASFVSAKQLSFAEHYAFWILLC